ncbi:hypothetical protein K431DRAFT_281277 [Polychaeton citri CBS 116435]|uniref:uS12 prolyl 3,4-dihydroxylase n=1 Tax=Polychaeton citri CBS 116435 TaxID=1314669 RepID=A0A9P4UU46_9PEZI|nr:hypothetical protein K431DRAFT_281277 [Polychaeton citri CBS 116435]
MAKRKATEAANGHVLSKKQATDNKGISAQDNFRKGLFSPEVVTDYKSQYAESQPYRHAVIHSLIDESLLRDVRTEIIDNIHFTPKETDIYKIHQSGDLANLSGLHASALSKLPSLLTLRDTLYSADFRSWLSSVTGAGPLSGIKTDMAVNVYVPGCHLLCHDDVIGSRRVSYILYLTNPDVPWKAEWGGALRLYPTDEMKDSDGKEYKVPRAEWNVSIPPAWNQLSFFAVQPGESFHDVEEVYHRGQGDEGDDGGRVRMAISGWFHIPQEGEDGYEPGLEEALAEKSSLQQLQGKADQFDEPQPKWIDPEETQLIAEINGKGKAQATEKEEEEEEEGELTKADLQFLLNYMTPNYLTPDTVEELTSLFQEESCLYLTNFLNKKFSAHLKDHITSSPLTSRKLQTSKPPHKHRYQYIHPSLPSVTLVGSEKQPVEDLLDNFLPSLAFRKWLALATDLDLQKCEVLARRFRKSLDYQLAQGYDGEDPVLECVLSITPSGGWGGEEGKEDDEGDEDAATGEAEKVGNGNKDAVLKEKDIKDAATDEEDNPGGYELYMAGDDDEDEVGDAGSNHGVEIPQNVASFTGAGNRRPAKAKKADPAIYKAAAEGDDEDDGILISNPPSWNTLNVVLRDSGTLRFVKYISKRAEGDRYDLCGQWEVLADDEDGENEE